MTVTQLPKSNADDVASNLVYDAIVDDITKPGDSLAALLDKMAAMAREIGGEERVIKADWKDMLDEFNREGIEKSEMFAVTDRQLIAGGDIWAREWMLCNIAKHLHQELERRCLEFPLAAHISSIDYGEDGSINSWSKRKE